LHGVDLHGVWGLSVLKVIGCCTNVHIPRFFLRLKNFHVDFTKLGAQTKKDTEMDVTS
jgi:hypothetical protein